MPLREDINAWQSRWQSGQTRWDQGQEHPEVSRLIQHAALEGGLLPGAFVYSGGCGRAHSEAFLARQGYRVVATDLVPEAISAAKLLYGTEVSLTLRCEDVLEVRPEETGRYDAVFDRAMLCALQPQNRSTYLAGVAARLKKGGLFMSIPFRKVDKPEGPPFAIDELSLSALMSPLFELCWAQAAAAPPPGGHVQEEWLCIWRRKD